MIVLPLLGVLGGELQGFRLPHDRCLEVPGLRVGGSQSVDDPGFLPSRQFAGPYGGVDRFSPVA